MARKYRKIDPRIWKDETFRRLTVEEKLTAFYLITAQSNRVGLFAFSPAMAAEDLGMPPARFTRVFESVAKALEWVYDASARVLWIPTWWRYNNPENENHFKGCLTDVHDVPTSPLVARFLANRLDLPGYAAKLIDSYAIAMGWLDPQSDGSSPDSYAKSGAGAGTEAGTGAEAGAGAGPTRVRATAGEASYSPDFEAFWEAHPRKVKKADAWKAWTQVEAQRPALEVILAKLDQLKATRQWRERGGHFVPYPATWLRAHGWHDDPAALNTSGSEAARPRAFQPANTDPRRPVVEVEEP